MSCRGLILLTLVMAAWPAHAQGVLVRNVTVVSPEREVPLQGVDVALEGGRIVAISTQLAAPPGASIIDGTGRYLIPGLIDSHVHLRAIPGMRRDHEERHPEIAAQARRQIPKSYLFQGFTTLVDLNADPGFVADWNAGIPSPRVHFCGAAPIANGYPMPFQPEAERYRASPNFLYDPRQADTIPPEFAPQDHTPAAVVSRIADAGADCVKLYYDRGYGGFLDWPNPTVEMARQVVDAAHARGMVVALHANAYDAQAFGLEAGIDVLAHGAWHWGGMNLEAGLPPPIEQVLQHIAERGIGYQATAQVLQGEMDLFDPAFLDDPRLADVLPAGLLAWYRGDEAGSFRAVLEEDYGDPDLLARFVRDPGPGDHAALARAAQDRLARVVANLAAQGATFLLGSDTPSSPTYSNVPGLNSRMEIERLAEMGLSPRQIFEAATVNNARAFGLDAEIGTIEPGKRADLLLLSQNPLESTRAYDTIEQVILAGEPIGRRALSARTAE